MPAATPRVPAGSDENTRSLARRAERYAALAILWDESLLPRVRKCRRTPRAAEGVSLIVSRPPGGARADAGYGNLTTCGSVWACPVCSAKILGGRQDELQRALGAWDDQGGRVALLTLTMRHRADQPLALLWDALSAAWNKVTSGRAWVAAQAKYGAPVERTVTRGARKGQRVTENRIGWARVVEGTHGEKHGWHLHVHAALLLPATITGKELDDLGCELFQRWRDELVRRGLSAPLARRGGLDVKLWDGKAGVLSEYFTKNEYAADAGKLAAELTRSDLKAGGAGNRTPFRILRDVVATASADDLDRWHEWEKASTGRRMLTWSAGLRDLLLPEVEQDDQELAEAELGGQVELVIPNESWKQIIRDRTNCELLEVAETGPGAAEAWLRERGLAWLHPPTQHHSGLEGRDPTRLEVG